MTAASSVSGLVTSAAAKLSSLRPSKAPGAMPLRLVGRTDTPRPVVSAGEALLGGTVEDPEHIRLETRARLRRIFSAHNTRKLGDIEVLMEEWKGREDVLLQKVEAKYADQSSLPSPEELELGSGAHQQ